MKQSRRWAAWLSALMLAASLTVMPREGAAWTPYIDTVDPPVTEGEPDGPPALVIRPQLPWAISVTFHQGRLLILLRPTRDLRHDLRLQTRAESVKAR